MFPHLNVAQNVESGLHHEPPGRGSALTGEMLSIVGLSGLEKKILYGLSARQRQRAALAYALAPRAQVVLLGESFSKLDLELRQLLGEETLHVLRHLAGTTVVARHDQSEAFPLTDVLGIILHGTLRRWAADCKLNDERVGRFVVELIGQGDFFRGLFVVPESIVVKGGLVKVHRAYQRSRGRVLLATWYVQATENPTRVVS